MIVVLMGVSGIGKTTVGKLLAARTRWKFEDADDYHSEEHRRKMAAAIPLTDADRLPWLTALNERMMQYRQRGQSAILACSALKEKYREVLARGFSKDEMVFVYLHAPAALIKQRLGARFHAFMSAALLDSQLAALEVPSEAWAVSVDGTPEEAVDDIVARLQKAGVITAGAEK
jgi:gluconokinase